MRARIKFTTDIVEDSLVGILKEHHWWPHFDQSSQDAESLISEIRDSVEEGDVGLFMGSRKFVLSHTGTESKGTLSYEHQVWVLRILNPSIHLLQLACEIFVAHIEENALRNNKKIAFCGADSDRGTATQGRSNLGHTERPRGIRKKSSRNGVLDRRDRRQS